MAISQTYTNINTREIEIIKNALIIYELIFNNFVVLLINYYTLLAQKINIK
jgi:hypothetical protein